MKEALLTFVIVGGGPTGVECAGAISELINVVIRKDYPKLDFKSVRIVLAEMMDNLLPGMASKMGEIAQRTLRDKKHVEVFLEKTVASYDGQTVTFKNAEPVSCRTLIWAAGIQAAKLVDNLDVKKGSSGRLIVQPTLQLPAYSQVFALGDAAIL